MANTIRFGVDFDVKNSSLNQLKSSLQQIKKLSVDDIMKINPSNAAQAKDTLLQIKQQAINVQNALRNAFNAKLGTTNIEAFHQSLKKSESSIQQVYQTFSKAGAAGQSAFRNLANQVLNTNVQLKESHAILDKMATTLVNTVKWNAASSAVNALSRSVEQAWGYVKNLDTSLNDIRIVTGKTAEEMGAFAEKANAVAQSLGKTTVDYTNAALIYAQQGLSDRQIEQRAAITLKTANVTGQSTQAVSEQLTAVWNGYKVNAEEAQLYVDRLAAVAATTASDLEELSTGMSKVASAANLMGVGQDQLAAQLSTIISVTREAPETIGTSLKTIYARISDIKSGVAEDGATLGYYSGKMAEFGINVLDANGNLRDMGTVMEEIGGKWDTLTREQQIYLTQTMAGQRQYSRLLALFDNWGEYTKALETARNAEGALQDQQDIYMESTVAHLNELKSAVENIWDSFINTDSVNSLVDGLTVVANTAAKFVDSIGGGSAILTALGATGVNVLSGHIAKGINTVISNFEVAKQNARELNLALQAIQKFQGIPGLDEATQKLLNYRQQLYESSKFLSPEKFSEAQNLINQATQATNKLGQLQAQKEILDGIINKIAQTENAWKGLDEIMQDSAKQDAVIKKISEQQLGFNQLRESLVKYNEELLKLGKSDTGTDNASKQLQGLREQLTKYISELGNLASEGNMQKHEEQIAKLREQLEKLNNVSEDELREGLKQVSFQLEGLAQTAGEAAQNVREQLQQNFQGAKESITRQVEEAERVVDQLFTELDDQSRNLDRTTNVQRFTKLAGGISQVAMSIQQLHSLGQIWSEDDVSLGEKLLETVLNLSFTLPMLIDGFIGINKVLKLFKIQMVKNAAAQTANAAAATAQSVAEGAAATAMNAAAGAAARQATAAGAAAVATEAAGAAAGRAAGSFTLFGRAISMASFTPYLLGITAVIGAVLFGMGVLDQANQDLIESNQKLIESENKKQEEIAKNKQAYDAIDELNQKYKEGEITRSELKSQVQDLVDQYELQGTTVKELTSDYDNLSQSIAKARQDAANEEYDSVKRERQAAEDNILPKAKGKIGENGYAFGDNFYLQTNLSKNKKINQLLDQSGFNRGKGGATTIKTEADTENLIKLYDSLEKTVEKARELREQGEITSAEFEKSFGDINDWLGRMKDTVEGYKNGLQQEAKAMADQVGWSKSKGLEQMDAASQYIYQRGVLISQLQSKLKEAGDTTTDAAELVDNFLKENFNEVYNKFNQLAPKIDEFKEKFGKAIPDDVFEKLNSLDELQLAALLELPSSTLQSWEDVRDAIESISKIDFSNIDAVKNLQGAQQAASDQYNLYQSLEDQVKAGKTISSKEMESLPDQLQEFFSMMANGSYKMTEDAETFYDKVNAMKLDGFHDAIDQINDELGKIGKIKDLGEDFKYKDIDKEALSSGGGLFGRNKEVDYGLAKEQLAYLKAVTDSNSELNISLDKWQQQIEKQQLSKQAVRDIAEEVSRAGDQTDNLDKKSEKLAESAAKLKEQLHDALHPLDEDVDSDTVSKLADHIQEIAESSEDFDDSLKNNRQAAEDAAEALLRFNDAVQDVTKNYDDWIQALEGDSLADKVVAFEQLRDAYGDLLDMDGSVFSDSFLSNVDNLNLMKAAIEGNEQAYNELLAIADQDIKTQITAQMADTTPFWDEYNHIQSMMEELGYNTYDVGVELNDTDFLNSLTNLVNSADMTAEQASELLEGMGIDAEIVPVEESTTETQEFASSKTTLKPETGDVQYPVPTMGGGIGGVIGKVINAIKYVTGTVKSFSIQSDPSVEEVQTTKQAKAYGLKVVSARKGGNGGGLSGGAKIRNRGGGGSGKKSGGGGKKKGGGGKKKGGSGGKKGGSGKKSGGSGSSGSSSAPSPDTSQKDFKQELEDERDIYHDINVEIDKINRGLQRVEKVQERLYGKALIDNLNMQTKILEEQKGKLLEKQQIQKDDLAHQKQMLQALGVVFDAYGNISNYMSILAQKQAVVNGLVAQYNALISSYNASTNQEYKEGLADQIEAINKQIEAAEKDLENTKSKIQDYDSLREEMEDLVDEIDDIAQQQIEINISKFRMQLQIRLEMGQAERDWNNFKRNVLQHTNILNDSNFSSIIKDLSRDLSNATSYFYTSQSKEGSFIKLREQMEATRHEIEMIDKYGESAIYGDNKAQAMEDLETDLKELMGELEDLRSLIDDIDQAYFDTIDDVIDNFDEQIQNYEFIGELIQHDIDLLSLLYGDKNYDAMNNYYGTLQANQKQQLDSLRMQRDFWKDQWDQALANGEEANVAKQFEEQYKNAIKNLNSVMEQSAQTLRDKYMNVINQIFDELDKRITSGKGLDYVSTEWDLINKNADEYLDTINAAFEVQNLESKFAKALEDNNNKNLKGQKAIKNLMDQQLGILKSKEKISQYDIDRAEKLLQIEQARIALEEAQSSKTSMRLKRDSQGNYSYQYVADENNVAEAQENLITAQQDLYNFDKDAYKQNLNDMLQAWRDFQSEYQEIVTDTQLTEEERIAKTALLRQQYGEFINDKVAQNQDIRTNLTSSAFSAIADIYDTDVANYNAMSEQEKEILMNDLIPAWNSGVQEMANAFAGEGGFIPTCEQAFDDIHKKTKEYEKDLEQLAKTADVKLYEVKRGTDNVAESFRKLVENNQQLTNRMNDEITAVRTLKDEAHALVSEYNDVYTSALRAVTGINDFMQAQRAQAAAAAAGYGANNNTDSGSGSETDTSQGSGDGDPKVGDVVTFTGKYYFDSYGQTPLGSKYAGVENGVVIDDSSSVKYGGTNKVTGPFDVHIKSADGVYSDLGWVKLSQLRGFASGGYTGMWAGNEGRLGVLHQKEIVLNASDTKNLLDAVSVMRSVMGSLKGNMYARISDINSNFGSALLNNESNLEQNVHIEASFPNVNSKKEIEEAFNELVNLAAQRALRK